MGALGVLLFTLLAVKATSLPRSPSLLTFCIFPTPISLGPWMVG